MKYDRTVKAHRQQLDNIFQKFRAATPAIPKNGWIAEIRKSLLMTSRQLAKRMKVTQSVVAGLENSERRRAISLKSLDKVAEALNCDLYYIMVPKEPISKILEKRAKKVLEQEDKKIESSMKLEQQGTDKKWQKKVDHALEASILILSKDKRLWD